MFLTRTCFIAILCTASVFVHAADKAVVSIPGGAAITADDLLNEALRLSPQAQAQTFARPINMAQLGQNLVIQRELARRAEADGLQNDPKIAAALRAAHERVLAEAALARAEGTPPDRAALERLALNQYNAAPEKFDTPEQIRVSHILIDAKSCDPEARAKELLALARAPGADFAALAKSSSQDPGSAAKGGDLGFFTRGRMAPAFEAAAFAMKQPGEISDIVKSEFGYHIIRFGERKPASRQPFESVRDGLVKSLAESDSRTRRREIVDGLSAGIQFDREAIEALVAARQGGAKAN